MQEIDRLLKEMEAAGASDLHVKTGKPPVVRVDGVMRPLPLPPVTREEVERIVQNVLPPRLFEQYAREREADASYLPQDGHDRFRVNAFYQRTVPGLVFRRIPREIPTLDGLGHPQVLKKLCALEKGLVVVTGPTGSGKSTTLAAMVRYINERQPLHVVTIEDPMEFEHEDIQCLIDQREVGLDTLSFTEALRRALRQDPDVILLGEMRDAESMMIATSAAETGHLVLSTLHTNDAKQSVSRIVNTFPPEQHFQTRLKLAAALQGVISQTLVPKKGGGRVAVLEILISTPYVRDLIAKGKYEELDEAIEQGTHYGMQSMNQDILAKWMTDVITDEDALASSVRPQDLQVLMEQFRAKKSRWLSGEGKPAAGRGSEKHGMI
jgi:twitching motility protein PilT